MNGFPFRKDRGIAVLGLNSAGDPWFSWASGPNGAKSYGAAKVTASQKTPEVAADAPPPQILQEPAAFYAPAALNTVEDVAAFGAGPGTERLRGSMQNTAVFKIISEML